MKAGMAAMKDKFPHYRHHGINKEGSYGRAAEGSHRLGYFTMIAAEALAHIPGISTTSEAYCGAGRLCPSI
jgi:hypothetical protein